MCIESQEKKDSSSGTFRNCVDNFRAEDIKISSAVEADLLVLPRMTSFTNSSPRRK